MAFFSFLTLCFSDKCLKPIYLATFDFLSWQKRLVNITQNPKLWHEIPQPCSLNRSHITCNILSFHNRCLNQLWLLAFTWNDKYSTRKIYIAESIVSKLLASTKIWIWKFNHLLMCWFWYVNMYFFVSLNISKSFLQLVNGWILVYYESTKHANCMVNFRTSTHVDTSNY